MRGKSQLRWTQGSMMEAVEYYLNSVVLQDDVRVVKVARDNQDPSLGVDAFVIDYEEVAEDGE